MAVYTEQNDYIIVLQQEQAQQEAARHEQLIASIEALADAISQLAAVVSAVIAAQANDNDMRITDE